MGESAASYVVLASEVVDCGFWELRESGVVCCSRESGRCWIFSSGQQVWPGDIICDCQTSLG